MMRLRYYIFIRGQLPIIILTLFLFSCNSLSLFSEESYEIVLENFEQLSENEIQFDVVLHNTGKSFFINDIQVEIQFDPGILNTGTYINNAGLNIIVDSSELFYPPKNENLTIAFEENRFIIVTPKVLLLDELQYLNTNQSIRIARLQILLSYLDKRGAFLNNMPKFSIDQYASKVQYGMVNSFNQKEDFGKELQGKELLNYIPDRPLASHYFSGSGFWNEKIENNYIHWNNHPDTHPDYAHKLPGKNADVIIAGNVVIQTGEFVELISNTKGSGGTMTIVAQKEQTYRIELFSNDENFAVMLFLYDDFSELPNPTDVDSGTELYLYSFCLANCVEFLNWTDQYGNVLSTSSMFGPYEMPAADMEITANWSSGSKTVDGAGVEYQNAGLVIEPGGSLTVDTIYNDHEAGAEAIVLQSTAGDDATGSLIHQNQGVGATVERFIDRWPAESPWHGWHLISSPVEAMPIRPEFVPVGEDGTIPPWVDFYKWDEAHVQDHEGDMLTGWWINSKLSGGIWNPEFEDHFQTGRGYLIAYGSDQNKEELACVNTHRFSGPLVVNNIPVTNLSYSADGNHAGWHLLGNPFASALDWTKGDWQKVNITGGPKIWHEAYASYTPVIDIIPAMNGFMIHTGGNGSLQIPAEARVHDPAGWYKEHPHDEPTPHIRLTAHDPANQTAQQTVIIIRPDAVAGFDPAHDTPYLPGYAPLFYSISDNVPLALNCQPEFAGDLIVPLGFKKNASTEFYISLTQNLTGMDLVLEDLLTGHVHPLSESQPYHFTSSGGDPVQRFSLHINPDQTTETPREPIHRLLHAYVYQKTICVNTIGHITTIQIFDVQGRMLKHQQLHGSGQHTLKYDLPPGIYVARLSDENRVLTVKVML